jgi:hypothetical protein
LIGAIYAPLSIPERGALYYQALAYAFSLERQEKSVPPFSERMGISRPKEKQINDLDSATRNSLWNICNRYFYFRAERAFGRIKSDPHLYNIACNIFENFLKQPIDSIPYASSEFIAHQLAIFQKASWYRVYEIIEFLSETLNGSNGEKFCQDINTVLEREKTVYRFVGGQIASISNTTEISEIETAIMQSAKFTPVGQHIDTALTLFSKKPTPDYRNSIKESISAVEAAARLIAQLPTATLGDAIKRIDNKHNLHSAFKDGILKIYGYTNDRGGIRHSLTEGTNVDEADARFMLVFCSAFANYLISRYDDVVE